MHCPFLKETQVKFCEQSSQRKLIRQEGAPDTDTCSSRAYLGCPLYAAAPEEPASQASCPHFRHSLVQYCSAASVTKFVPYSESVLSRCGNGGYRYCEVYAEYANAGDLGAALPGPGVVTGEEAPEERMVDDIRVPNWLSYTANHMWLQQDDDGTCHIGIDGLLAKALGTIEDVVFINSAGFERPAVVLRAGGADFQLTFPNPVLLTGANYYLRSKPAKTLEQPYSSGWLFQGTATLKHVSEGLLRGTEAFHWMQSEVEALSHALHERILLGGLAADGGTFARGFLHDLGREQALALFNDFFSPFRRQVK
ncbi:MAG TPA: hypothetical protein VN428_09075 [Bryobacteraceae bacterium]|nr:hypothetical protein [Bryobacteraceae bacterium]